MQRSAEFVVACSNAAELLELIEEAFDVVDLSGQVGFAQLDAYSSTEINDAPIKTEEIAATEFNDDITMSNVTLGRNGNDISRAHATMSSGEFARLPPSCKTGGLRHKHDPPTLRPICRYITELYLAAIQPRRRCRATRAQQLYEARTPRSRMPQSATRLSPPWLIRVKRRLEGHGARDL
jgi:hypothetical protein